MNINTVKAPTPKEIFDLFAGDSEDPRVLESIQAMFNNNDVEQLREIVDSALDSLDWLDTVTQWVAQGVRSHLLTAGYPVEADKQRLLELVNKHEVTYVGGPEIGAIYRVSHAQSKRIAIRAAKAYDTVTEEAERTEQFGPVKVRAVKAVDHGGGVWYVELGFYDYPVSDGEGVSYNDLHPDN